MLGEMGSFYLSSYTEISDFKYYEIFAVNYIILLNLFLIVDYLMLSILW